MADINKIDSNLTGLRYCEEDSLGVLAAAASQFWIPLEPNSYSDFGGKTTTLARNPINSSRQRKKGVVTDIEASGGISTDITQTNLQDLLQGYFFADLRPKKEEAATSATASSKKYHIVTSGMKVGSLVFVSGFTNSTNNGLKRVTAVDATDITVAETLIDETAAGLVVEVGFQFTSGDATFDYNGASLPRLLDTTKDMADFALHPGEWVFIGDSANSAYSFTETQDNGFMRVRAVATHAISFDKTQVQTVDSAGTSKTIRIFYGRVLKNETGTDIVRRSYTLERTLGANDDSDITKQQADYIVGAVPGQATINCPTANKVTVDLTFQGLHSTTIDENVAGANKLLSKAAVVAGSALNAPDIVESDAFNTSTDVTRINLSVFTEGTTAPTPLFAFMQDFKLTINNNISPDKAVGTIGAFEVTAGTFEVGGSITAYFANVEAVDAVNDNSDISLDIHFVKANSGISIDLPLITLGDARPVVEQDKAITLPLDMPAATGAKIASTLNHTALISFFDYLPDSAS